MSMQARLSTANRLSDAFRGICALVGVAVLAVGVPVALIAWVGWPLPAEMPTMSQITDALRDTYIPDEFLVKALALVCWVVWVELVASLIVEAVAYARGRHAAPVPLAGGVQKAAARLVATVALLGALVYTKGLPDALQDQRKPLVLMAQPVPAEVTPMPSDPGAPVDASGMAAGALAPPTYEVQRRDTLWDIAETHLGDPFRWPEIFEINKGRVQPDGRCLTDPDMIHPGWQLELPADAIGVAAPEGAPPPGVPLPSGAKPGDPTPPGVPTPTPPQGEDSGTGMELIDEGDIAPTGPVLISETSAGSNPGAGPRRPDDHEAPPFDPNVMVLLPEDD